MQLLGRLRITFEFLSASQMASRAPCTSGICQQPLYTKRWSPYDSLHAANKPQIHDVGGLLECYPLLRHAHDHVGMLAQVKRYVAHQPQIGKRSVACSLRAPATISPASNRQPKRSPALLEPLGEPNTAKGLCRSSHPPCNQDLELGLRLGKLPGWH